MSADADIPDRICGCLDCTQPAVAIVDHPEHGERAACRDHAEGHEVIEQLADLGSVENASETAVNMFTTDSIVNSGGESGSAEWSDAVDGEVGR